MAAMADKELVAGTTPTRQVRVWAAHRGTVTRLINQLDKVLSLADINRLKQVRQSLMTKMEILSRMDEKILALVDEGQVEAEIEQADLVREKAELAIINIDEALTSLPKSSESKKSSPSNRESSCSPLSCGSETNPTVDGQRDNASPSPPVTIEKSPVTLSLYRSTHTTTATSCEAGLPLDYNEISD